MQASNRKAIIKTFCQELIVDSVFRYYISKELMQSIQLNAKPLGDWQSASPKGKLGSLWSGLLPFKFYSV